MKFTSIQVHFSEAKERTMNLGSTVFNNENGHLFLVIFNYVNGQISNNYDLTFLSKLNF